MVRLKVSREVAVLRSRRSRERQEAHRQLVAALVSYLRVEQEPDAMRALAQLPEAANDRDAVAAAQTAYREVVGNHPVPFRTRAPLNLGLYLAAHSPIEASAMLEQVVETAPEEYTAEASLWLGVVLADLGQTDRAATAYQVSIQTGHAHYAPRAMVNLGKLHFEQGNIAAAQSAFEQAISSEHPEHANSARLNLAGVLVHEGDLDGARAIYQWAVEAGDPRLAPVAAENLRRLDAAGERDTRQQARDVLAQLIIVPSWYQTREILHRHAALLDDVEGLLREVMRSVTETEDPGQQLPDDVGKFLALLDRCREVGIDRAVAELSGLDDDVPVEIRLLMLQAAEAGERLGQDAGQRSLDDALAACDQLLERPAWNELRPSAQLECLMRLAKVRVRLFAHTQDAQHLDRAADLLAQAPALALREELDPAPYAERHSDFLRLRRAARTLPALQRFVDAIATGDAGVVIEECPELLDEHTLDLLSSVLEMPELGLNSQETKEGLRAGIETLRLCRRVGVDTTLATVGPAGQRLLELLGGLNTTVEGIRRHLNEHPELLSDAADLLLQRLVDAGGDRVAQGRFGEAELAEVREIQVLLRRCREVGVDAGIEDVTMTRLRAQYGSRSELATRAMAELLGAGSPEAARAVVEQHRDVLLDDATDKTLTAMLDEAERRTDAPRATFIRDLRRSLRRHRIFGPDETAAQEAVVDLLALDDQPEATLRHLLREHPALLLPVADEFLVELPNSLGEEIRRDLFETIEARRSLLRACREVGVEAALAAAWDEGQLLTRVLRATFREALELTIQVQEGEAGKLDKAGQLWDEILRHPLPAGRARPLIVTEQHAIFNLVAHRQTGVAEAIDAAVAGFDEAVSRTAPDAPELSRRLQFLAEALVDRYERRGRADDLRAADSTLERIARLLPPDAARSTDHRNLLAKTLLRRYSRFGASSDLDRAIILWEEAAETAPDSEQQTIMLSNLSNALARRFHRDGRIDDLDRAIAMTAELTKRQSGDPQSRARVLANHGTNLLSRYSVTHDPPDLDDAVAALQQATDSAAPGSPDRARYLTALGNALAVRADDAKHRGDADQSIRVLEAAVSATPPGSFEQANRLNNLGAGYLHRYGLTHRRRDLDRAVAAFEGSVKATPADEPGYAWRITNLAGALAYRYSRRPNDQDLRRAVTLFREGSTRSLVGNVKAALQAAVRWGDWAEERSSWKEAAEAYSLGLEATQRLFRTQLVRSQKEAWLREARELFPMAASALLRGGDVPAAVTALERGRAMLLSEALERNRGELHRLAELGHGALRRRYLQAVRRLNDLEAVVTAQQTTPESGWQALEGRTAHEELDAVIAEIRQVPGHT